MITRRHFELRPAFSHSLSRGVKYNGKDHRFIDRWTFCVLVIAALVASALGAIGAHTLFPTGWWVPIAFAVVQFGVSMSLWELPRISPWRALWVVLCWFVFISVSIAGDFCATCIKISQQLTANVVTAQAREAEKVRDRYQTALYPEGSGAVMAPRVAVDPNPRNFVDMIEKARAIFLGPNSPISPPQRLQILGNIVSAAFYQIAALLSSLIRRDRHRNARAQTGFIASIARSAPPPPELPQGRPPAGRPKLRVVSRGATP